MENQIKPTFLSTNTEDFLIRFLDTFDGEKNLKRDNDKIIGSALLYEKIRVAIEYQEEHLVFKNAISRILRRKIALESGIKPSQLLNDLISELAWANYLNPEALQDEDIAKISLVIEKYLTILKNSCSGRYAKNDIHRIIIDWLSCEIDDIFRPSRENNYLIDYVYEILKQNIDFENVKISAEDNELQLKIAIYALILKPDLPLIQYWLLKKIYPDWSKQSPEEVKKITRSFDPFYNKIDRQLNHPLRKNYLSFARRFIAPFILLRSVLVTKNFDLTKLKERPAILYDAMMVEYDALVARGRQKVWRGTIRALIFILLSKVSLAFILEIPFDKIISGKVDPLSLIVNVTLPPVLMFISGTFVKSPPNRNRQVVATAISRIISSGKVDDKQYFLVKPRKTNTFAIFNLIYSIFSVVVLAGVIWLLIYFNFNIVSIILFFLFVSIVSFFAFRIRNIALELAMKRSKDDALTTVVELIFLPFIKIGRNISDRFATFNPAILFLDFIIEAPLKTIIRIVNSWLRFLNNKKEDLEF